MGRKRVRVSRPVDAVRKTRARSRRLQRYERVLRRRGACSLRDAVAFARESGVAVQMEHDDGHADGDAPAGLEACEAAGVYWSGLDKDRLFAGLRRYSRFAPDAIAEFIGTKTPIEVAAYLQLLHSEASARLPPLARYTLPAACEMSDEWVRLEDVESTRCARMEDRLARQLTMVRRGDSARQRQRGHCRSRGRKGKQHRPVHTLFTYDRLLSILSLMRSYEAPHAPKLTALSPQVASMLQQLARFLTSKLVVAATGFENMRYSVNSRAHAYEITPEDVFDAREATRLGERDFLQHFYARLEDRLNRVPVEYKSSDLVASDVEEDPSGLRDRGDDASDAAELDLADDVRASLDDDMSDLLDDVIATLEEIALWHCYATGRGRFSVMGRRAVMLQVSRLQEHLRSIDIREFCTLFDQFQQASPSSKAGMSASLSIDRDDKDHGPHSAWLGMAPMDWEREYVMPSRKANHDPIARHYRSTKSSAAAKNCSSPEPSAEILGEYPSDLGAESP